MSLAGRVVSQVKNVPGNGVPLVRQFGIEKFKKRPQSGDRSWITQVTVVKSTLSFLKAPT